MKKGFLKGFVLGGMIFGTVSFAAVSYTALEATFPLMINGEEWECDKPVVVVEGSTYLPLKSIGEVLGVDVKWNSDLRRVEIGEESKSGLKSYSRLAPAPIGESQSIKVSTYSEEYTATVEVKDIIRGKKAWNRIKDANMFNSEPESGYEYILAKISVKVDNVKNDKAISINSFDFTCYSANNAKYDKWFTVVTPEPELNTTLYSGATTSGYVVFKVLETDEAPKIVFGQKYDGTGGIWFALTK